MVASVLTVAVAVLTFWVVRNPPLRKVSSLRRRCFGIPDRGGELDDSDSGRMFCDGKYRRKPGDPQLLVGLGYIVIAVFIFQKTSRHAQSDDGTDALYSFASNHLAVQPILSVGYRLVSGRASVTSGHWTHWIICIHTHSRI